MKRFFLTVIILLLTGLVVFAQQSGGSNRPSSAETKQTASQYLSTARSNASQFDSTQNNLNTRNTSNKDAYTFNQLKTELDNLESKITEEQNKRNASLDRGLKIDQESIDRIQRLMDQYNAKLAQMEALTR